MKRLTILILALACMVSCGRGEYAIVSGYAQGGIFTVKYSRSGVRLSAEKVDEHIRELLGQIDRSVSGYNKASILSRSNAGEAVEPDRIFMDLFRAGQRYYQESEGALDVASGALFDIWGFGFANPSMPSDETVQAVKEACGMKWLMDKDAEYFRSECPEGRIKLNFNAIAQGYSCDLIASYLHSIGCRNMLVDIGEIYCEGVNPSGMPWRIGIDTPVDGNNTPGASISGLIEMPVEGCGVVTSGNYRKFYVKDGRKYAHTIDPRSGYPVQHNLLSATIIAPTATDADAIATWCMVLGLDDSKEFLGTRPELKAWLIYDDNGQMKTWSTEK